MAFERDMLNQLNVRLSENDYRPVLISGVHGCGKTTLAGQFAGRFTQSMLFDLSKPVDRQAFYGNPPGNLHFSDLYQFRSRDPHGGRTLLFLDNIQAARDIWDRVASLPNRPEKVFLLGGSEKQEGGGRAADGSGQAIFQNPQPELLLQPLSFHEFLLACGEREAHALYTETPCPDHTHAKLLSLFHRYVMVGGMPEAVAAWVEERNMVRVEKVFDHILSGWNRALSEQMKGRKRATLAGSILADAFPFASARITFHHFANRPVRSREAASAFRSLEEGMFLRLIHPVTRTAPEALPDPERAPRLQFADTGMVVYFSGIRHAVSESNDMTGLFGGQVVRHIAGQEMQASEILHRIDDDGSQTNIRHRNGIGFWVRDKNASRAEVDFVVRFNGWLIPVVARSGEPGKLRSLHSFLDAAPHPYAVRLCADRLNVKKTTTIAGKPYFLLSLPYYLAGRIKEHLEGFVKYVG